MRDADVRDVVRRSLQDAHRDDLDTRIVEEMGIWGGSARIDVAVINGELHGVELKSERDTLARLDRQIELYDKVFDRVTLVVGLNHLDGALRKAPEWWGLTTALPTDSGIVLSAHREAAMNPAVSAFHLARLMWRDEALECLARHGGTRGLVRAASDALAEVLAARLDLTTLRLEVRTKLKSRTNWLR